MTRFRCVDDQRAAGFPVTAACEAAGVSTSGFYDWSAREAAGPTERQVAEAELVELMREIFDASDGNYGVPRMHDELRRGGAARQREAGAPPDALARDGRSMPAPALPDHVPRPRRLRDPRPRRSLLRARRAGLGMGSGHRAPRGALEPCGGERTPPRACRSRRVEAEGSLISGDRGEGGSGPDNDGTDQHCQMIRVRLARRKGVREEPAAERSSRQTTSSKPGGSGLGCNAHLHVGMRGTLGLGDVAGREATVKACGVVVAMLQGHSWAPTPSNGSRVNVGTIPTVPSPASSQLVGGKTCRRSMPSGWDGGPVVVRARESCAHGEGVQRVRSINADRGGRR